jgi:hypothetical protein
MEAYHIFGLLGKRYSEVTTYHKYDEKHIPMEFLIMNQKN